jgi:hypothetical protein
MHAKPILAGPSLLICAMGFLPSLASQVSAATPTDSVVVAAEPNQPEPDSDSDSDSDEGCGPGSSITIPLDRTILDLPK